jgi:hypothetical protein
MGSPQAGWHFLLQLGPQRQLISFVARKQHVKNVQRSFMPQRFLPVPSKGGGAQFVGPLAQFLL